MGSCLLWLFVFVVGSSIFEIMLILWMIIDVLSTCEMCELKPICLMRLNPFELGLSSYLLSVGPMHDNYYCKIRDSGKMQRYCLIVVSLPLLYSNQEKVTQLALWLSG